MCDLKIIGDVKSELPEELVGQMGKLTKEIDDSTKFKVIEKNFADLPLKPAPIVVTS